MAVGSPQIFRQMNFLNRLTHSFEEDISVPTSQGRPSNMHNEDNFDYAIELSPEEEYRSLC